MEYRPLASLIPNKDNPKSHDLAGIGDSMRRFGLIDVITLDERTGFIVSGHGRTDTLRQLREAGAPPPDGTEDRDGDWWTPVIVGWASKDDDEALAATVALNRWTEVGGWDVEKVIGQLGHLADLPDGLAGIGFGRSDLDDLLARQQENGPDLPGADPWGFGDEDRQVRSIMLDLPLDDYRWATGVCVRARAAYGVDSNAALFLALLDEDAVLAEAG